jgi:hypothetical protein
MQSLPSIGSVLARLEAIPWWVWGALGVLVVIIGLISVAQAVLDRRQGESVSRTADRAVGNASGATEAVGNVARRGSLFGLGILGGVLSVGLMFVGDIWNIIQGSPLLFGWVGNVGLLFAENAGITSLGLDLIVWISLAALIIGLAEVFG